MDKIKMYLTVSLLFILSLHLYAKDPVLNKNDKLPYLTKQGNATQLIVDGKPFIIRGGELGNSTFTGIEYMAKVWPKLKALNMNTVLAPVYWELIEPEEGKFDFKLYDELIGEARKNNLKLILLWFGSWKNSMSSHAPAWVKTDQKRFPRARDENGISQEILHPLVKNNLKADMMHLMPDGNT
jgi:beta-galactosidase GanA